MENKPFISQEEEQGGETPVKEGGEETTEETSE